MKTKTRRLRLEDEDKDKDEKEEESVPTMYDILKNMKHQTNKRLMKRIQ